MTVHTSENTEVIVIPTRMYGLRLLCALAALAFCACDDGGSADDPDAPEVIEDATAADDDASPPDAEVPDVAQPDSGPDAGPLVIDAPEALLYTSDPVTDDGELSRVTLSPVITEDGALTSPWVEVFNCLNEEGGVQASPYPGITFTLCHEVQVARPNADGHYTDIAPPEDEGDPNDSFSELMMYHHVNIVHDYFKNIHGFEGLDFPLPALVNVQFKVDPPGIAAQFGIPADADGWVPFSNAAYFPKESWEAFAAQLGLPPRDKDSIIFFQGEKDFAYDARVIYHEYTHAVVGTSRLQVPAVADQYGLTNAAPSMNEGLADYFAGTIADDPVIGAYVGVMGLGLRNLSEPRRCPQDTIDEVHAHGQLVATTAWSMRQAIGAEIADAIIYRALEQFTLETTHEEAAALMLAEAEIEGAEIAEQVGAVFEDHGFGECVRSIPFAPFVAAESRDGLPHVVESTQSVGFPGFAAIGVPAYKQFHIDPADGAVAVRLDWTMEPGLAFGPGPGAPPPALDVALRRDEPVHLETKDTIELTYDARFSPTLEDQSQSVVLTGDCLAAESGRVHLLLLNRGESPARIVEMDIEWLDAVDEGTPVEDCAVDED